MLKTGLLWISLLLIMTLGFGCRVNHQAHSDSLLKDIQNRGYMVIGVKYDAPPFGFLGADGKLQGYEIDLAHEIAKRILGKADAVKFVQVNTSTRIAALQSKEVDFVLATMTITPQRAQIVNFSKPYFHAAQAMLVKETSPFQRLMDLKNKIIIYIIGSTSDAKLDKLHLSQRILGFKSPTEAFSALQTGRGDAFTVDDSILRGFLEEYCGYRLLPERLSSEPYGMAFRKDKASLPLQQKVEAVVNELKHDGFMNALNEKWTRPQNASVCKAS